MSRQFIAASERAVGHVHVLLITTGSVASVKAPLIVSELLKVGSLHCLSRTVTNTANHQYKNVKIEVVATKISLVFYDPKDIDKAGSRVWVDEDEWQVSPLTALFS